MNVSQPRDEKASLKGDIKTGRRGIIEERQSLI